MFYLAANSGNSDTASTCWQLLGSNVIKLGSGSCATAFVNWFVPFPVRYRATTQYVNTFVKQRQSSGSQCYQTWTYYTYGYDYSVSTVCITGEASGQMYAQVPGYGSAIVYANLNNNTWWANVVYGVTPDP